MNEYVAAASSSTRRGILAMLVDANGGGDCYDLVIALWRPGCRALEHVCVLQTFNTQNETGTIGCPSVC
jgi:hypothetical protein